MKIKAKPTVHDHLLDDNDYVGLTPGSSYEVVEIDHQNYRVISDADGEPYLYPKELFDIIDPHIPEDWETLRYEDGQYYIACPKLSVGCFFEEYFDGVATAVATFEAYRLLRGLPARKARRR